MINQEELAICRRRNTHKNIAFEGWMPCKWCGTWVRLVEKVEEREDEPPDEEKGMRHMNALLIEKLRKKP